MTRSRQTPKPLEIKEANVAKDAVSDVGTGFAHRRTHSQIQGELVRERIHLNIEKSKAVSGYDSPILNAPSSAL